MPAEKMTLDEAIDSALDTEVVEEVETPEVVEESEETTEEEVEEVEETPESDDDLSADQLLYAKALYKRLRDPKTSVETINEMVQRAGYTLTQAKKAGESEKTEIATDILEIFKEELGDDFELLAGSRLVQALSKVLDLKVKPLQTKIDEAEFTSRKKDVDKALEWAYDSLDGFKQNESLILQKMQTYPYTGDGSYKTYLQEINAIATSNASQKRTDRAQSNMKNDVKASRAVRSSATKPVQAMSLDEAIEQALADTKF